MFDKLEDLLIRYEELMSELSEPDVANNPERFRKLMKEQSDILPIVEAFKEYKQCKQTAVKTMQPPTIKFFPFFLGFFLYRGFAAIKSPAVCIRIAPRLCR